MDLSSARRQFFVYFPALHFRSFDLYQLFYCYLEIQGIYRNIQRTNSRGYDQVRNILSQPG